MVALAIKPSVRTEREVVNLDRLDRVNSRWLLNEVQLETELAVRDENKIQARVFNNEITRVVVDSRASVTTTDAQEEIILRSPRNVRLFSAMDRRLTFFYTETAVLAEAVAFAWRALSGLLRKRTGDAWRNINFFVQDWEKKVGKEYTAIGGVLKFLETTQSTDLTVYIQGPTVEYRRTAIYYHKGTGGRRAQTTFFTKQSSGYKKDPSRKGLDRLRFLSPGTVRINRQKEEFGSGIVLRGTASKRGKKNYSMLLAKAVNELVRDRVRRQFKDIRVYYKFHPGRGRNDPLPIVHSPKWRPTGENRYIPVIMIGLKKPSKTPR